VYGVAFYVLIKSAFVGKKTLKINISFIQPYRSARNITKTHKQFQNSRHQNGGMTYVPN
jgi:hypothetical protein